MLMAQRKAHTRPVRQREQEDMTNAYTINEGRHISAAGKQFHVSRKTLDDRVTWKISVDASYGRKPA